MKLSASMIALGMSLALTSAASFADPPLNITIPLGQATSLNPSEMDTLSLSALGVGEAYKVTCRISDPNYANTVATINVSTQGSVKLGNISDNGKVIGIGFTENAPLSDTQPENTLVIDNVVTSAAGASLIIKNATSNKEHVNSIDVSQCIAQGESTISKK